RGVVAADLRELGDAAVRTALIGGVVDEIAARAALAVVAPDVAQVQPVADLVDGGAAAVERRGGGAGGAEAPVVDDDAVRLGVAAGELGVSEQAAAEGAHPQVQVSVGGPGVGPSGIGVLDGGVRVDHRGLRPRAGDAAG